MSRRLLLPLLAALTVLLAGAPAALAAAGPAAAGGGPSARIAQDDAEDPAAEAPDDDAAADAGCDETADGEIVCDDDWVEGDDDVTELCDDDWSDDEDVAGDDDAEIATDDDCAEPQDSAAAPRVAALRATVTGVGRRARVHVAFRLDRAGKVRLTLERVGVSAGASRGGKRCAGAASKSRRGCGVALRGGIDVNGRSGANSAELPRRWSGRALAPGAYRLTATPVQRGGASATTTFSLAASAAKR